MQRQCGVLMPIFSLPSKYGIGDFGKESYRFIDIISGAGQKVWQILPLVQTGYGNSPYSSVCSTSFNPYFISVELLKEQGLITSEELKFSLVHKNKKYIDYGELYAVRYPLLKKAFERFDKNSPAFIRYIKSKESFDYALFMAIKEASGQKHFYEWEKGLKYRDKKELSRFANAYNEQILFWQFIQFVAKSQWISLKKYAGKKGVKIMGDMPLYVATDSVDVWVNPQLFKLDENLLPKKVAGVPPDYFCEDGQLWGNPVYDYDKHQESGFKWWATRLKNALKVFDYIRIDHFRALDRYYQIDSDKDNAREGEWVKVPSIPLFNEIEKQVDKTKIIAEDLGIIDDGVRELLKTLNYPGMKILSFAFNGDENNLYLPEKIEENSICYTGTHDNDTLIGLIESMNEWDYNNLVNGVKKSLQKFGIDIAVNDKFSLAKAVIELGFASKANLLVLPVHDLLMLNTEYRINQPGVVKETNWAVKFDKIQIASKNFSKLKTLCKKYDR